MYKTYVLSSTKLVQVLIVSDDKIDFVASEHPSTAKALIAKSHKISISSLDATLQKAIKAKGYSPDFDLYEYTGGATKADKTEKVHKPAKEPKAPKTAKKTASKKAK